ncbi:hypothetical protein R70006_05054 [Paraburkholderia domus]|uniref:helix-turn-helix domain-containing protein n=1 Tax=Paraburkholderia domus TaxID=2793075 RepID=UPI001912A83B|nr:helix-turn-helix transcriptional regulator [Paraburkholderia domus]MBK5051709.1 helix-turn-helix domain-containing protein [Burkholderia sp. R-70006]CAE6795526.1 hypothetical protein R70006_05054 [Paraburkholderia domus]
MSSLGVFIRTRRKQLGLTQAALAMRMGVDDAYVSAVETGKRTPDGSQFLTMMCQALQLNDDQANELVAAARQSQRIFRLPAELSLRKHEVLQALALDPQLTDEDMETFAIVHAALVRARGGKSDSSPVGTIRGELPGRRAGESDAVEG